MSENSVACLLHTKAFPQFDSFAMSFVPSIATQLIHILFSTEKCNLIMMLFHFWDESDVVLFEAHHWHDATMMKINEPSKISGTKAEFLGIRSTLPFLRFKKEER
uniref:Ionotropic glutamate receptor C-terminal domain-containing protein n=1 Tax=Parascaris univalens TaxID=6257 RepID=A0A915C7Q2_PARUN